MTYEQRGEKESQASVVDGKTPKLAEQLVVVRQSHLIEERKNLE